MVDWEAIEIELLPGERELLLEYGCPFSDAKAQLEKCASSHDVEVLTISRFYLNQMIGDLSYSINKRTKGRIQRALNLKHQDHPTGGEGRLSRMVDSRRESCATTILDLAACSLIDM